MKKDLYDMVGSDLRDITVEDLVRALLERMILQDTCSAGIAVQVGPDIFTLMLRHVHDEDEDVLAQLTPIIDPKKLN